MSTIRTMYLLQQLLIVLYMLTSYVYCNTVCTDWGSNNFINCSTRIQEEIPTDTLVFNPKTHFNNPSVIIYGPHGQNSNSFWTHLAKYNDILHTKGNFDREQMVNRDTSPFPVTFQTSILNFIPGSPSKTIYLTIHVIDLNDNVPRFKMGSNILTNNTLQLNKFESPNVDTILTLEPVDYDEGTNGTSSVELLQPDPPMFNISIIYDGPNPTTVYVIPMNPLDREVRDMYMFQLIAYEGVSNPANATLNVTLTVKDINDNLPQFNETEYFTSTSESSHVGTDLIHVHANDPDIGTNAAITYTIQDVCAKRTTESSCLDVSEPWPFVLDTESGLLQIKEMLNYEEVVQYRLTIDASNPNEQQGGSSTALVNVLIADVNDNPPEVTDFLATPSLSENSLVNSTYGSFKVRDNDSEPFSIFRLSLLDNSTMFNSTTFGLRTSSQNSFNIILLSPLDRETQDVYSLIILAQDALNESLFTTFNFSVVVSDFNDHPPIFNSVTDPWVFQEESPVDTLVIHLSATDKDTGSNAAIQYSLPPMSQTWPYQSNFTIQPYTGKVLAAVLLDRETTPTLSILVQARDLNGTGLATQLILNISLQDINDNAPVITTLIPNQISISENANINTLVIDVDATDADTSTNAEISYSLILLSPQSVQLPFIITPSSGRVTVNGTLDHETTPLYMVRLSVFDGVNPPTQRNLNINILDVNDNSPTFSNNNYYRTLHENVTINTPVITMTASDIDSPQITNITYHLISGGNSHFNLNSATGVITTAATLDWESQSAYTLTIRANDGFGRISQTDANLIITVIDVNDEIPRFTGAPYVFTVDEGTGTSAYVGHVTVESHEIGQNGAPLFFIDTLGVPFEINSTGSIFTTTNLNRENQSVYFFTVRVEDVAPPPHYNTTIVTVTVADINDNAPVFMYNLVQLSVSEIQAVNSPFYTAHATDDDIYPNNITIYDLNPPSQKFQINSDTGELSLTTSLNYDVQQNVLLNIRAKDSGNPNVYFAIQQVNITILDDNNTNITFPSNFPLEYYLREDAPLNYVLLNFTGEDHKGNPRLHLTYYLTDQSGATPIAFGLERESSTGYAILTVSAALDREVTANYVLNITITDDTTTPPSTVTQYLTVTLTDINDNSPTFSLTSYTMSIQEEQSGKRDIGSVTATDPDNGTNGTITYSLQNTMSGLFSINSVSGTLYQEESLDRETQDSYTLTVIASDQGQPPRQTQVSVVVMVTDINDNSPTFTPTKVEIEENLKVGTIITTLIGHDADIGLNGEVTFTYTPASTATSHFQLLPNGTIRVTQVPDYESQTLFVFYVVAQDGGQPSLQYTSNITIHVTDLNDNCPKFTLPLSQYNISVPENTSTGSLLINITAIDLDQGAAGDVGYILKNIADSHQFNIDSETGELTLIALLDYETTPYYEIVVLAYDKGLPRNRICEQTVYISVVNINEYDPHFNTLLYVFSVDEGQSSGTSIGIIRGYDLDANSILTYSLANSEFFEIISTTGQLRTLVTFDYETVPLYNTTLIVTDQGGKTGNALLVIVVNNINDNNPVFPVNTYTASILETAVVGAPVITVIATDADNVTNTPVTYNIVGGDNGDLFSVNTITGEVYVNGVLDFETTSQYVLTVQATDTGSPNRTTTTNVIVTVINVNEYSPVFSMSSYTFNLTENLPSGTIVGRVNATDLDSGSYGSVKYYLSSSLFSISESTGNIETLVPINREATPTLSPLVVVASDSYKNTTVNVNIHINDVNDSPPYFTQNLYEFSIDLNSTNGAIIGTVNAIDPDLYPVTYYSMLNPPPSMPINITNSTGTVQVTGPLTHVNVPYQFTVKATDDDNATFTDTTIVRVYVVTSNDHYPNFTQPTYNVTIQENYAPTQPIVTTTANDPDTGSNGLIKYSLTPSGDLTLNQFSINQLSGALSLESSLDYESASFHDIVVYARDSTPSHPRTATTHVLITVTNVNDNAPMFTNFTSSISISYVPYIGLELYRLFASDSDGSSYSFQLWTQTNKFSVDTDTGVLRNIIPLNTTVTYSLELRVYDSNFTTSKIMTVSIVPPSSQLSPSFTSPSSSQTISETTSIGSTINTITALNPPSNYYLVCCGDSLPFTVNSQTGTLIVSKSLDYEQVQAYQLVIEARKIAPNGTRYSAFHQISLSIINVNEHTPQFTQVTTPITISENTASGLLLTQVTAEDKDTGSFGDITYQIINGNIDDTFNIDSSNGAITVTSGKTLDRESISEYTLSVRAMDGGGKSSVAMVTIVLQDVNDSPPIFSKNYTIGVYEPGHIGDRVIQVNAIDSDSDSILTYQLGSVRAFADNTYNGISNKFSINSSTGMISLNGVVNFETANRYEFTVTVSDSHYTDTTNVTVNIFDINDNLPSFLSYNSNPSIHELSPAGTTLLQLTAADSDSVRYSIIRYSLGNDWPSNKFTIDPYGGTIYVQEPMNVSELASNCNGHFRFTATVYASDGIHNSSASVTVNLQDINKFAPVFVGSPYNIIVSETTPIGASLIPGELFITDNDCGLNNYYTTTFPNYYYQPRNLFSFNLVNNGEYELVTKATLPQGVYHFRLEAYNNRPFPSAVRYYKASYSHVTITVLPNNTHSPVFNIPGPLTVYENSDIDTEVGFVIATDLDLGVSGLVTYTLNDTSVPFVINNSTGRVTVNGLLDYETKTSYNLHVIASDNGYPKRSVDTFIVVQVLDRDDNPPVFISTIFTGTIKENSPINSTVLQLNVTDADSVVRVKYSIKNSTRNLPFQLDPVTGILTTAGNIDYETQTFYLLSVLGTSLGNSTIMTSATIRINVVSVNEYAPVLPEFNEPVMVQLGLPKGSVVTTVIATDGDKGKDGEVVYAFEPTNRYLKTYSNGSIILNVSQNEMILTSNNIKRQENNSDIKITLTVVAMDTGTPPKNDTKDMIVIIPEGHIISPPISPSQPTLTLKVMVTMSTVAGTLIIIILLIIFLLMGVYIRSHRLKKKKLDLRQPTSRQSSSIVAVTSPQLTAIPLEEDDSGGVELQQISRISNTATPTKNKQEEVERARRHSPHTRSTSDLASSIATDTLNLTQETNFPYTKGQIEAIYAANADLLYDGSQASVHTFGSEGGGESDGDEFENLYYTKYSEIDVEGSLICADDDLSSLGKPDHNSISESSECLREDDYHFSQSTNPWSSRRSINDLMAEHSSALLYSFTHSQGVPPHYGPSSQGVAPHYPSSQGVPPHYGASTQGSSTSLLHSQSRPSHHQYRGGSERDIPRQHYSQPHHRLPHPPTSNYDYYHHHRHEAETPPIPPSLVHHRQYPPPPSRNTASPRRYETTVMDYRHHSQSIPRGPPPPPYYTQDPVSLTGQSSRVARENFYSMDPAQLHYDRQTLSTSSTSLSTSASHPYRGREYN